MPEAIAFSTVERVAKGDRSRRQHVCALSRSNEYPSLSALCSFPKPGKQASVPANLEPKIARIGPDTRPMLSFLYATGTLQNDQKIDSLRNPVPWRSMPSTPAGI